MEQALRALLLGTTGIADVVGGRIDWGVRPQGSALPAVVLSTPSGVPQMNLAGPSGWTRSRVRAECWGRSYLDAKRVADAIGGRGGRLVGLRETAGSVRLRTLVIGRFSDADSDTTGTLHRTILDVLVWHDA